MNSLSKVPPNFDSIAVIVAFDYYDGPETGLAVFESGEGVRFSSVGESEARDQRGFEMAVISGDWWSNIEALMQVEKLIEHRRIIVPGPSSTITELRKKVERAVAKTLFVAVGTPNLGGLSIAEVDDQKMANLRELGRSPAAFKLACRIATERAGRA